MGQVMSLGMSLMNTSDTVDNKPGLREKVDALVALAAKSKITLREWKHVNALKVYAEG